MTVDVPKHSDSQCRLLSGGTGSFAVKSLGCQQGKQGITLINQHHPLPMMLWQIGS